MGSVVTDLTKTESEENDTQEEVCHLSQGYQPIMTESLREQLRTEQLNDSIGQFSKIIPDYHKP